MNSNYEYEEEKGRFVLTTRTLVNFAIDAEAEVKVMDSCFDLVKTLKGSPEHRFS